MNKKNWESYQFRKWKK